MHESAVPENATHESTAQELAAAESVAPRDRGTQGSPREAVSAPRNRTRCRSRPCGALRDRRGRGGGHRGGRDGAARGFGGALTVVSAESARPGCQALIAGASFIGLEAAVLRQRRMHVHVVAPESRPMERILGPAMGDFIRSLHESHRVVSHLGRTVAAIDARACAAPLAVCVEPGNYGQTGR